ncbi:acyl-CoA carboxylase epsilon subunit, partial [Nostocoides sp.]
MSGAPSGSGGEAPTLRVVRGDPSAAELAALVAVLGVAAGTAA